MAIGRSDRMEQQLERDRQSCFDDGVLGNLPHGCLFYPGCGMGGRHDCMHPFHLFRQYVSEFWFVDRYLISHPENFRQPAPLFRDDSELKIFHKSIEDLGDQEPDDDSDDSRSQRHLHVIEKYCERDDRVITIHRCHGFGQNMLQQLEQKISVFFVRRCPVGADSNTAAWLDDPLASRLMDAMNSGGILVTDGVSSRSDHSSYQAFRSSAKVDGMQAKRSKQPFVDCSGNQIECVGYAGDGYGPTLAWRVVKTKS